MTFKGGKLVINTSKGIVKQNDSDHTVHPVSARDRTRLKQLSDALRQWRPQPYRNDDANASH
uniref:Uncharacterized protein n=1 Tax=Paraburkholderia sprentiae WSM5005 TaxID=754502 RepID=A0A1I9YU59_9BURK